jgi:hypothetical protein
MKLGFPIKNSIKVFDTFDCPVWRVIVICSQNDKTLEVLKV